MAKIKNCIVPSVFAYSLLFVVMLSRFFFVVSSNYTCVVTVASKEVDKLTEKMKAINVDKFEKMVRDKKKRRPVRLVVPTNLDTPSTPPRGLHVGLHATSHSAK